LELSVRDCLFIIFSSLPGFYLAWQPCFIIITAFGESKASVITIRNVTMIGLATKLIVKKVRRKDKHNSGYQQCGLIERKNLFQDEKNETNCKNRQW
jgi:hypothetical protein